MRCFVALDLPEPVRNHLAKVTAPLRERFDVKWVPPEQMHLTLAFAGEAPDERAREFADLVRSLPLPPIQLSLDSLGCFPAKGEPRGVWAGLGGDIAAVMALHAELVARGGEFGIEREKRGFTPHVTLGRVKGRFGVYALADAAAKLGEQLNRKPFTPTGLALYASELRPTGPSHRALGGKPCPKPPAAAD